MNSANNTRVVNVWPKGVSVEAVKTNGNKAHYAYLDGEIVQPVTLDTDKFKAAFGFVPCTGTIAQ